MPDQNTDIIARLQREILPLQGLALPPGNAVDTGLGFMQTAFPNAGFPTGAVHEFLCDGAENTAAASGFITCLLSALMQEDAAAVWIGSSQTVFPRGLAGFGVRPDRIIFIEGRKEKDVLWIMEEALKCGGLAAVVGELQEIGFTASRRLQLAVEKSRVTGFIIRRDPRNLNTTACVARWKVSPLPGGQEEDLPGLGFPRWQVELQKIRNGKPGVWEIEWSQRKFHPVFRQTVLPPEQKRKTG